MCLLLFLGFYTDKPPYSGPSRSFVNFVKYSENAMLLLYRPQPSVIDQYRETLGNKLLKFNDINSLTSFLDKLHGAFLFIADWYKALLFLKMLKLLSKALSKAKLVPIIYSQVYHGTLNPTSMKSKIIFTLISRLLRENNNIIANSMTGFRFLVKYYKVSPLGYVYPPVDTAVFSFSKVDKKNRFRVLLYLGSGIDTDIKLLKKLVNILLARKDVEEVYLLGNKPLQLKLISEGTSRHKLRPLIDVSDEFLAGVYSKVSLTICPQKWEPYGYVVAESIASLTPVLAFNSMGPKELISLTRCGILVNSQKEMINIVNHIDLDDIEEIIKNCRTNIIRDLISPEASINKLMNLISRLRIEV